MMTQVYQLISKGFSIIPIIKDGKTPLVSWKKYQFERADEAQVSQWSMQFPGCNWAIVTGHISNLLVIDVDDEDALDDVGDIVGDTRPSVKTPRGWHYYFAMSAGYRNSVALRPHIDVRAEGGYVLIPPSVVGGKSYSWLREAQREVFPTHLGKSDVRSVDSFDHPSIRRMASCQVGKRNNQLYKSTLDISRIEDDNLRAQLLAQLEATACSVGLTTSEVSRTMASALQRTRNSTTRPLPQSIREYQGNDAGNAQLLVDLYGHNLRYVHPLNSWMIWDETDNRWYRDMTNSIRMLAIQATYEREKLAQVEGVEEQHRKWAFSARSEKALNSALRLAQSMPGVSDNGENWDLLPYYLPFLNGLYDVRTGALVANERKYYITQTIPFNYRPDAICPIWHRTLEQITLNDLAYKQFMQQSFGYSATGYTNEQMLFLCVGNGANGKSLLSNAVRELLGGYGYNTPIETFDYEARGAATQNLVALRGRRFVTASEANEDAQFNEARIKMLTGEDKITARLLYQNEVSFSLSSKFWFALNHIPTIVDSSDATTRRLCILPFNAKFSGPSADPKLREKLLSEAEGILAWIADGARQWYQHQDLRSRLPDVSKDALARFKAESNPLAEFIADKFVDNSNAKASASIFQEAYRRWADAQGIRRRLSRPKVNALMESMGYRRERTSKGWFFLGLQLAEDNLRDNLADPSHSPA